MGAKVKRAQDLQPGDMLLFPDGSTEMLGMVQQHFMTVRVSWVKPENVLSMRLKEGKAQFHAFDKVTVIVADSVLQGAG